MINNLRIGYAIGLGTAGTGLTFSWLQWVSADLGSLATISGSALSITLIISHWRKMRRDAEKHELEKKLLLQQLKNNHEDTEV